MHNISENKNENYLLVEMLLSVADLVANRDFNIDNNKNKIEILDKDKDKSNSDIWKNIFTHLFEKCLHPHDEIRHSALHIFSLIFNNYGSYFNYNLWNFAFKEMFFEM